MASYHESASTTVADNPYAEIFVPAVGRLLDEICKHLSVGGCFRPGNRLLADWLDYASAGQIPHLLSQLVYDGWISYDRDSRLITLLRDPYADQSIGSTDRDAEKSALNDESLGAIDLIDRRSTQQIETTPIDPIDRDLSEQGAEYTRDRSDRSNRQCMEDSCLTTTESFSESVVVTKTQIPCVAHSISPIDHPIALLLAELLPPPGRGVLEKVLAVVPPWTPQQIRDRYEHDKPRIERPGSKYTWGIFWDCLKAGERAPARADPNQPLDPAAYAGRDGFKLGSDVSDQAKESLHDRAARLVPASPTDRYAGQDFVWMQGQLLMQDWTDAQALEALAARRRRRGTP